MKRAFRHISFILLSIGFSTGMLFAQQRLIVDKSGKGDFKTIQGAINSLPDSSLTPRTIFIRNGIYKEKLYIEKANIILEGEDRSQVIITASIARDEWRCGHMDDWGVATLNIGANDLTLKHLTVVNSYGFDHKWPPVIYCAADTGDKKLRQLKKDGHQMALRTMNLATRLAAVDCHFKAFGGDTVSSWETGNGMWYFKDCIMEGGVDFYCPRGWAWAENCTFTSHSGTAAIWHDGSGNKDSKTVLVNCRFSGFDGFQLGRYHKDAQFFLINCAFAANMRDQAIYRVPTSNTIQWGERIYYYNCHRDGGNDFTWYSNNLPETIKPVDITTSWVFGSRWNPVF